MHKVTVAGPGTDVGKTAVSAILVALMGGDYWKPIQCGEEEGSDTATMEKLVGTERHHIHTPAYALKAPLSPHHAARLENVSFNLDGIKPPQTSRPLIIETVGGIFTPLSEKVLAVDLFKRWDSRWIIVSKHYLGSINHTLLTLDALRRQNIPVAGLIFNGEPNPDSEAAILSISQVPFLGRLLPETIIDQHTIQRYAKQWRPRLSPLFH